MGYLISDLSGCCTPYLAYQGICWWYVRIPISGHPYEVIPLVGGSMDTMPGYLSGGLCSWTPYLVLCCYGSQDHYTPIQTSGTTYVRYTISSTPSVVVHMLGGRMDTMSCYGCYATSAPTSYLWSWVCPGTSPDTPLR
jgi:hypothetical protein